jgi:hypothetical protein
MAAEENNMAAGQQLKRLGGQFLGRRSTIWLPLERQSDCRRPPA